MNVHIILMNFLYNIVFYITTFDAYIFVMLPYIMKTIVELDPECRETIFFSLYYYLICKYSIAIIRFCIESEIQETRLYLSSDDESSKLKKVILMFILLLPSYISIPLLVFYYVDSEDL